MPFDENAPSTGNNILSDIDQIREDLNYLKDWLDAIDPEKDNKVVSAEQADNADKIEGQLLGKERFEVSSNIGIEKTLTPDEEVKVGEIFVEIPPNGGKLIIKGLRTTLHAGYVNLLLKASGEEYQNSKREEFPNYTLYENTDPDYTELLSFGVYAVNVDSLNDQYIYKYDNFWFDLSVE